MLTQDELKCVLDYSPETGVFTRLVSKRSDLVGRPAGTLDSKGACQINVGGRLYLAHRLAWLYMTGSFPVMDIDHRDGNPANNCWGNLRLATESQNIANGKKAKNNTSGFKGVWFHKTTGRWISYVRVNGKAIYLGLFDTPEEAGAAYMTAAQKYFGEFARAA